MARRLGTFSKDPKISQMVLMFVDFKSEIRPF